MDNGKFSNGTCTVARGISRVGDAWSMLILRELGYGHSRFEQFRQSLGIAPNILTRRLAAMVEDGLIEKRRYSARPPRDEYVLTEAGRDFLPVLQAISGWARKHHGEGRTSYFIDKETGERIEPVVVDAVTGAPIGSRPLEFVMPD